MRIFVTGGAGFIGKYCVKAFSRKKLDIECKKSKEGDTEHSVASIQKAKMELEFLPKYSFEDELVRMLKEQE